MSVEDQFRSLTAELEALKNRVRNFNQTSHWQTDGEWKESVLRKVLAGHLPRHLEPLRGFVTDGVRSTRQIDLLIYDGTRPVLFRSGDLVFVTPDAATGIIEVKSRLDTVSALKAALEPLASNIELIRRSGSGSAFAGLFAFDTKFDAANLMSILELLRNVSGGNSARVVDILCLGSSLFILNWEGSLLAEGSRSKDSRWHAYHLPDMAPGYFTSNIVHWTAPHSVQGNIQAWFPQGPKEVLGNEDLGHSVIVRGGKHGL